MRYIVILACITISCQFLVAQDFPGGYVPEDSYGEKNKSKSSVDPYFFFDLKYAATTDIYSLELGAGLGALINKQFLLAGEFYNLISNDARVQIDDSTRNAVNNDYGGIAFSYSLFPLEPIMLSVGTLAGMGKVSNSVGNVYGVANYAEDDWYFVVEPRVKAGFKVYKGIWLGLSIAYRYSMGVNYFNLENKDLSGPAFSIGFFTL